MLKNVLKPQTCAECRICCSFVKADAWESPVFYEKEMECIRNLGIDETHFKRIADVNGEAAYQAQYAFHREDEILLCPCLDEKSGCMLKENKPFECKIWPIRIFENDGESYLGLAEACPAFADEKREALLQELDENGLRKKLLSLKEEQKLRKEIHPEYSRI